MLKHHLYVSTCNIDIDKRTEEIERLVAHAREKNALSGVTGALVFSGARFVQYLEGGPDQVDATLARIRSDPRHEQLTTLDEGYSNQRRFEDWTLCYGGPSLYVDRHIKVLIGSDRHRPGRGRQVAQLMRLVDCLTKSREDGLRLSPHFDFA